MFNSNHIIIDLANSSKQIVTAFFAQHPELANDREFVESLRIARNEVIRNRIMSSAEAWDKLPTDTIVLPKRSGLLKVLFPLYVSTPEHPEGVLYNPDNYCVFRTTGGRLYNYMPNDYKVADTFTWTDKDFARKCANPMPIGNATEEGRKNLAEVAASITNEADRAEFLEFFSLFAIDFFLAKTKVEHRQLIVVTDDMYADGIDWLIDEWVGTLDQNGGYYIPAGVITNVVAGDAIVLNDEVYRIEKTLFNETHARTAN